MKSLYLAAIMLLVVPCALFAETNPETETEARARRKPVSDANITGHVESSANGEHLPYITITVEGTTIGTSTDATGHYFLKNLPEGEFTIVASSLGFRRSEQKIKTISKKTIEVNFLLKPETVSMDEVVVSATRNETNKKTSSSIVNVVSAKTFESTSSTILAETMNFQSGLRVENNCGNCGTTQLRINGLEGQYSQILLDSRPIFSSLSSVYGLEQLPVAMIERVEVVRGGGSALFGASAIGGVVNIITREPLRNSVSLSNTTNIFEDGTTDYNVGLNGSFVSDDHRAGMYLFGMVKDRSAYDRNDDGFSDLAEISSETIGFRGYYKTSLNSRIGAEYHHIREFRRGGDNLDRPPHEAMVAEETRHNINGGGLNFDWFTSDYRHRMSLYTSAQDIKRQSYYGADMNPDSYGRTKDRTMVFGGQYTYTFDKLLFMPSELTAGVEFTHNKLHDVILGYDRDFEQTSKVGGGFLQNEWKSEKASILIGARLDKHNMVKDPVLSPRANVRYSPNEKIGLRASYSSGYRAPQAYNEDLHVEAVSGTVVLITLDPDLKPEYSHSVNASVDLYHNFGRLQTNLLIEGFYTKLDDVFSLKKIGEDAQGNIEMLRHNASGAKVQGVNFEAKLGVPAIFDMQLGYTLQRSRYDKPEVWSQDPAVVPQRKMLRSPDNYGYITSNFYPATDFTVSLFATYTGSMLVSHNAGFVAADTERTTPKFFDLGAKLSYTFRLKGDVALEVNAGVKNIFDSYQGDLDSGSLKDATYVYGPSLPRTFFFGVKFSM